MPLTITGSDVYPASFPIPVDAEKVTAASVGVALGALADRTTFHHRRIELAEDGVQVGTLDVAGAATFHGPAVFEGAVHVAAAFTATSIALDALASFPRVVAASPIFDPTAWAWYVDDLSGEPVEADLTCSAAFRWCLLPLKVPHEATLVEVRARVSAPGSALIPASVNDRMRIRVYRRPLASDGLEAVGSAELDGSASTAAYNAQHLIEKTNVNHLVDTTAYAYYLGVRSDVDTYCHFHQAGYAFTAVALRPGGD